MRERTVRILTVWMDEIESIGQAWRGWDKDEHTTTKLGDGSIADFVLNYT